MNVLRVQNPMPAASQGARDHAVRTVMSSAAVGGDALLAELRRTEYGRLDAGGHVYLDYTGAGLYADSQLDEHVALLRDGVFGNPHSRQPDLGRDDRARRAGARGGARLLPRRARGVRRDLHAERDRCAAAGRRGLSVPARRPLPAHLRQPQLGQRHPRVRPRPRRRDDLRAERRAGPAGRRAACSRAT